MTIEQILALVPDEQRQEASEAINGLNPLDKIGSASEAVDFIKSNQVLRKGYDSIARMSIEAHKERYEAEELPKLKKTIRDELANELNPAETPEQKRLRELEQKLADKEKSEQMYQLKTSLRAKAKELGVDEDIAEKLALLQTDDHQGELAWFADKFQSAVKSTADNEINNRWPKGTPKSTAQVGGKITSIDQVPSNWTAKDYANAVEKGVIDYGD